MLDFVTAMPTEYLVPKVHERLVILTAQMMKFHVEATRDKS